MKSGKYSIIGLVSILSFLLIVSPLTFVPLIGSSIHSDNSKKLIEMQEPQVLEHAQRAKQSQFFENLGQVQSNDILFYGDVYGIGIGFAESSVIYRLQSSAIKAQQIDRNSDEIISENQEPIFVTLSFEGANSITPQGERALSHTSNFLIGNDPNLWYRGIRSFPEIIYPNLYENIDLIYRVSDEGLKYEFVVWPGGNPEDVRLEYNGIDSLSLDKDGDLVAETTFGSLLDKNLMIFQDTSEGRVKVEGYFILSDENSFSYRIDSDYDRNLPLVIDPFLLYSTFIGNSGYEEGQSITLDSSNNAYITGTTDSTNFPTTFGANDTTYNGGQDAFILKLSADGSTLIYSTFIGGSSYDGGWAIAVDESSNAYITGYTQSSDFPTTTEANDTSFAGTSEAFVIKLSADGSTMLYSTYLGGSSTDSAFGIALDSSNNAYLAGHTGSSDFPTTPGANDTTYNAERDVFILKLSEDGSTILYSTLVGGGSDDRAWGIVLDSADYAYVTGSTNGIDFPTTPGANDTSHNGGWTAYVLKLSADGSTIVYSTFIDGGLDDIVTNIAIDGLNNTYITGTTADPSFNVTPSAYDTSYNGGDDGYILKLSADGSTILYSTYFGGSDDDRSKAISLDGLGNVYVTGETYSSNFPTTSRGYDDNYNLNGDAYLLKLSSDGTTLLYASYIGNFEMEEGYSLAVDSSMHVYLTGYTQSTTSINWFPTVMGSYDRSYNGGKDIFAMKVEIQDPILDIHTPINTIYGVDSVILNYSIESETEYTTSIILDGITNTTSYPNGSSWSDLSDGTHNLTIVISTPYSYDTISTVVFSIDTTAPDVDSPSDITYVEGALDNYINWSISDYSPGQYSVEGNGTNVGLTSWSENGTISINVDGLAFGYVYNHTIIVYDEFGMSSRDTVFVRILKRAIVSSPLDFVIEIGSTGHQISWTIGENWNPLPSYRIDGNATTIEWTLCENKTVLISADVWGVGIWNFTITLLDQLGYTTYDTVYVTVIDTTAPIVDSPLDVIYVEGTYANDIEWTASDLSPGTYEIFRNGTSIQSGYWEGSSVSVNVNGLFAGVYNYTLVVSDQSGNQVSDTVMVVVTPSTTTTPTPTEVVTVPEEDFIPVIMLGLVGLVAIVFVVIVIIRRRAH